MKANQIIKRVACVLTIGLLNIGFNAVGVGQDLDEIASRMAAKRNVQAGTQPANFAGQRKEIQVDSAQVACIYKIEVAAQSEGLLERLLVDEGDTVAKGDLMLTIDSRVAKAEESVAKKELEAAQKTASQVANVKYAEKAWEVSKEEYENEMSLWKQGATTYSVLRRKRLEAQRAQFGVDVAQVEHENNSLSADVAQERLNASRVKLDMYSVLAPYDGIIVERKRAQGEWVRSGDPVLRLVSMNEMKVQAYVPVNGISVSRLEGAPVRISIQISQTDVVNYDDAIITFVSPEIDAGRVRVSAKIANQKLNGGPWLLRDGMTATMTISLP